MASTTTKSSSLTVRTTYSRRRRSIPEIVPDSQSVEQRPAKDKKFSKAWWREVRAAGAHRRAALSGKLLPTADTSTDENEDADQADIPAISVPEQQQGASPQPTPLATAMHEPARSVAPQETGNMDLLATMAVEEDQRQAEPSESFIRRKGKELVDSSEDEEDGDGDWEEYMKFYTRQESEEEEDTEDENGQKAENVKEQGSEEEIFVPRDKVQMMKRTTRSVSKRQHAAASVGEPAAECPKRVIVIDSDKVTDHSDSASSEPENSEVREAGDEPEVEEEEVEPVEDREVNAREVFQYNIQGRSPFWENGFSTAMKYPPFIQRVVDH